MLQLDTYLFFDGTCAEAMRFYERTLGGELMLMKNSDAPAEARGPGDPERIMHARLRLDGRTLMASDWPTDRPYEGMNGFSLSLIYPTVAEARRAFDALSEGGKIGRAHV